MMGGPEEALFWASLIKEVIVVVATVVGVLIGIGGLQSWHAELRGRADFEVAQQILESLYRLRNAVQLVRNPGGIALTGDEAMLRRSERLRLQFSSRWPDVSASLSQLEAYCLRAQILWDVNFEALVHPLRIHLMRLHLAIEEFLDPASSHDKATERQHELLEIVYFTHRDTDQFRAEFEQIVRRINDAVRPHLGRPRLRLLPRRGL